MSDLDLQRRFRALEQALQDLRTERPVTPAWTRFQVRKTTSQTFAGNTWTQVTWNTVDTNVGGIYASNQAVLPAGWAVVTSAVTFGAIAASNEQFVVSLYRNGTRWLDGQRSYAASGSYVTYTGAWLVPAGTYSLYAIHGPSAGNETIYGGTWETWWQLFRIS